MVETAKKPKKPETAKKTAKKSATARKKSKDKAGGDGETYYAATVSVNGELRELYEKRRPRPRYAFHWIVQIMPDADETARRPLYASEVLAVASGVARSVVQLAQFALVEAQERGIYGGHIILPSRYDLVGLLSSNGSRVARAFDWLERMAVLRSEGGGVDGCGGYVLSPYVGYAGAMGCIDTVAAYAPGLWMPSPDAWREFWTEAVRGGILKSFARRVLERIDGEEKTVKRLKDG